jgi:hypothetical protein
MSFYDLFYGVFGIPMQRNTPKKMVFLKNSIFVVVEVSRYLKTPTYDLKQRRVCRP